MTGTAGSRNGRVRRACPALDGQSALSIARGCPPHAVVLDAMLPDFDGIQVLRRLRYENPELPVPPHAHRPRRPGTPARRLRRLCSNRPVGAGPGRPRADRGERGRKMSARMPLRPMRTRLLVFIGLTFVANHRHWTPCPARRLRHRCDPRGRSLAAADGRQPDPVPWNASCVSRLQPRHSALLSEPRERVGALPHGGPEPTCAPLPPHPAMPAPAHRQRSGPAPSVSAPAHTHPHGPYS